MLDHSDSWIPNGSSSSVIPMSENSNTEALPIKESILEEVAPATPSLLCFGKWTPNALHLPPKSSRDKTLNWLLRHTWMSNPWGSRVSQEQPHISTREPFTQGTFILCSSSWTIKEQRRTLIKLETWKSQEQVGAFLCRTNDNSGIYCSHGYSRQGKRE